MAQDIRAKGSFQEDIFADEPNKWSWPVTSIKSSRSINYDTHTSEIKSDESSSDSEDGFILHGDSSSQKKSFRPKNSSSASEGNNQDALSSYQSEGIIHEPLLPSIYDDDAQSGNPSANYDKKDLAFRSSFDASSKRVIETSPDSGARDKSIDEKDSNSSKRGESSEISSQNVQSGKKVSVERSPERRHKSRNSKSRSPDRKPRRRSRSRSPGWDRERRRRSPYRDSRHLKDRHSDRERSRSMKTRRSRSRDSKRRSRSRSKDVRKRSRSRDRHRRYRCRSSSRDRQRRKRYSRSRSKSGSRSRSRGRGGSSNRKPGSLPVTTTATTMTPQMALQQAMAAMSAKAQAMTGVTLPKYYNPAAVNPLKYAEQVQKRKLLWQTTEKVEEQPKNSVWDKLQFAQDQDGRMTAKFRKLMGIKSEGGEVPTTDDPADPQLPDHLQKQEELFRNLDQQYEMARVTTHTQRGVGLGYSAQALYPPAQK